MIDTLEFWPARVAVEGASAKDAAALPGGAKGAYNRKNKVAHVPTGESAWERAIRMHEAAHATWPLRGNTGHSDAPAQLVEDVHIHLKMPTVEQGGQARRDELTLVAEFLRRIGKDNIDYVSLDMRGMVGYEAARAQAIMQKSGGDFPILRRRIQTLLDRLGIAKLTDDLIAAVRAQNAKLAREIAKQIILTSAKPPEEKPESGTSGESSASDSKPDSGNNHSETDSSTSSTESAPSSDSGDAEDEAEAEEALDEAAKAEEKEILKSVCLRLKSRPSTPAKTRDAFTDAMATPKVDILILPGRVRPVRSKGHTLYSPSDTGSILRSARLAEIAAAPVPDGHIALEKRRGGSILIDASGSMALREPDLLDILTNCPAATIAYYSADTDAYHLGHPRPRGVVVVASLRGRRLCALDTAHGGGLPYTLYDSAHSGMVGGNYIDKWAIEWLLRQKGPRYMVTDVEFTGPFKAEAIALFRKSVQSGQITHCRTLTELRMALKKPRLTY